jgi:hypothetical protein
MPLEAEILYGFFCEFARSEPNGKATTIGLFGDICRFSASPPGLQPMLALHAYFRNPAQEAFDGSLRISWPGQREQDEVVFKIVPQAGASGTHLNFNFANAVFKEPGRIGATLTLRRLAAGPEIVRTFSLDVRFEPPGIASPAAA